MAEFHELVSNGKQAMPEVSAGLGPLVERLRAQAQDDLLLLAREANNQLPDGRSRRGVALETYTAAEQALVALSKITKNEAELFKCLAEWKEHSAATLGQLPQGDPRRAEAELQWQGLEKLCELDPHWPQREAPAKAQEPPLRRAA